MTAIAPLSWSADQLGDALTALVRRSRLSAAKVATANPASPDGPEATARWIEAAALALGVEAEPVESPYVELEQAIAGLAPALIRVRVEDEDRYLLLIGRSRRNVRVIDPRLRVSALPLAVLVDALTADLDAPLRGSVEELLDLAATPPPRRRRARQFLLSERLGAARIGGMWILRPAMTAGFWRQVRYRGVTGLLTLLLIAHATQYLLLIASWWPIAQALIHNQSAPGWIAAWALLVATAVPFRLLASWAAGTIGIECGAILKRRLLSGALALDPDLTRREGFGGLLGRVIESDAVETLALSGGVLGITAITELVIAMFVLHAGASPIGHPLLLVGCVMLAVLLGAGYIQRLAGWTRDRLELTNTLVERIIGHRTRLAQQPPRQWHLDEDRQLDAYGRASAAADRWLIAVTIIPRAWLAAGLLVLLPALALTPSTSTTALALSLGGLILAYRAVGKVVPLVADLGLAVVAWREVAPMVKANPSDTPTPARAAVERPSPAAERNGTDPLIAAEGLVFRYPVAADPIIRNCDLQIMRRDRLLIEGASGGGKSTLVSMLAGLRRPDAGLLLLDGLDRNTLGQDGWRERVVLAPQFHQNHVFSATFAFNLLMGRAWPPRAPDLRDAERMCRELGLGDLLDRMPDGILQMVGDMGWQLSHGERSRMFIARTLLQRADLVVLDENFAALDPETLRQCATSVLSHAPALVVISHA